MQSSERLCSFWRYGFRPGSAAAFGFALTCVVVATAFRFGLGLLVPTTLIFAAYYPAIMVSALLGGLWAGAAALMASGIVGWWMFLPPAYAFTLPLPPDAVTVVFFFFMSGIILAASESYRRLLQRYRQDEQYTALIIGELEHRLKNKMTTVQAVIHHQLRSYPDIQTDLDARLRALASTDELLLRTRGQYADLNEIVRAELIAYSCGEEPRIRLRGGSLALPPKLSVAVALITHELATNSAKYGALSREGGRLDVWWEQQGNGVQVVWQESGCPRQADKACDGFGSRLLRIALVPFNGQVERAIGPDGLYFRMSFELPDDDTPPTLLIARHRAELTTS